MKITLFKKCILNNNYQNAFSRGTYLKDGVAKSCLDHYLDTLPNVSFETDAIYYENEGELIFDILLLGTSTSYIYMYNYMRVQFNEVGSSTLGITKYCFVNSIRMKNGCVYLNYSEDIWSTYHNVIQGILPSYLKNSRVKQYQSFTPELIKLPTEYQGNGQLELNYTEDSSCFILVELQLYKLTSGDKVGFRQVRYCAVSLYDSESFLFSKANALRQIASIFNFSAEGELTATIYGSSSDWHYSIGDVYLLPSSFNINSYIDKTSVFAKYVNPYGSQSQPYYPCFYKLKEDNVNTYWPIKTGTITADYKNVSFGTFSKQFQLINNGIEVNYTISFAYDISNIAIRLSFQNQNFDITDDFYCYYPFTPITADGFAQRKIALAIQNTNLNVQAFKGGVGIGTSLTGIGASWGQNLLNAYDEGRLSLGVLQNSSLYTGRNLSGIADVAGAIKTQKLINSPIYSSAKANWGNSRYFLNYFVPLVLCKCSVSNANFVKNYINNFGYETYEFVSDFSKLQIMSPTYWQNNNINYNVIRFEKANVYGYFTNEIAEKLNQILENGIKIWFVDTMAEDNYVI